MTTIELNNYYPHLTERITLEVSDEIAVTLSIGAAAVTVINAASGSMASVPWMPSPVLRPMCPGPR